MISGQPYIAAKWSGMLPLESLDRTSAPFFTISRMMPMLPLNAAM